MIDALTKGLNTVKTFNTVLGKQIDKVKLL